ncbi:MAG: pyridoxamine 5'-phosphate oxidase family protein [Firmicutes bacterium]|nr:pyridoxamine 5'-phosphate oxidase family protein [Bacillota bacterium]
MFREMRRKNQALSREECVDILNRATSGTLAVSGDDGYPYAVPLSFVYNDNKIIFHCAKKGHKIDAIRRSDKVSFCVIDADDVVPEEFTTYFRSVIVFGRARILENDEIRAAINTLSEKYDFGDYDARKREIDKFFPALCMVEISVEHMTGKEAIELKAK